MTITDNLLAAIYAILLDLIFGDPLVWWHPIALMGKWIERVERLIYKDSIRAGGFLVLMTVLPVFGLGLVLDKWIEWPLVTAFILFWGLSGKSLARAIQKVRGCLESGDIESARKFLSWIVTRDTTHMDPDEVIRTAVESGSENLVDGVVAPIFYLGIGALLGSPIAVLSTFKMISTLDSMVGYRNDRYERFGKVSARLDDMVMFLPARIFLGLAVVLFPLLGFDLKKGLKIWQRDRGKTASINSGYPESLIAGGLGTWFGGNFTYFGKVKKNPVIGDPGKASNLNMIRKLERLIYWTSIAAGGGLWFVMGMI